MDSKINTEIERVEIIGVPISATNMDECVDFLVSNFEAVRGEYICVSNVHTTVMAHDDPCYKTVQSSSILSLPDGKPLSVLGSKAFPKMGRVTGPDLMRELFEDERASAFSHYFYGNTKENLDALIRKLEGSYPSLKIAGYEPSIFRPLTEAEENELCSRIDASHADFVWVGLGAPRQENLCFKLKGRTNSCMIGVGGAFNILAGITPEAPRWMQDLSLEWLYRLIQEPKRLFKRYFVTNTKFILYVMASKMRKA
ncbi:WecB/TagA/CpsF family glycosyltransferase [Slackia sp.]|uniref:WecB/TagA/CpsF family glycosyltransferase n=1 Tax=Slackia sp. TaxID=2049041 RepID=UPI00261C614F|nr:WecB/TagA/CpsF family glycosyltransferase [Slackia sp.]